jgi:hypothetical protein
MYTGRTVSRQHAYEYPRREVYCVASCVFPRSSCWTGDIGSAVPAASVAADVKVQLRLSMPDHRRKWRLKRR